jgi:hypothetical protein
MWLKTGGIVTLERIFDGFSGYEIQKKNFQFTFVSKDSKNRSVIWISWLNDNLLVGHKEEFSKYKRNSII